MIIRTENTAIATGIAKSAIELERLSVKNHKILDYGAGKLRNANYLISKGFNVSILDTPLQLERIKDKNLSIFENIFTIYDKPNKKYDRILCSFVLNVLPDISERSYVINNIYNLLKEDGIVFYEVRRGKGINNNKYKIPYKDGFAIGKNTIKTFQKPFSREDIYELFEKSSFKNLKISSGSDSYVIIAKKQ